VVWPKICLSPKRSIRDLTEKSHDGTSGQRCFLTLIGGAFDLFFRPFRAAHPIYGLATISFLAGAAAVLVFRYTSNQRAMRRVKNRIQAHVLEVRLFPDQLTVVLRAYARILRFTLIYLGYTLRPVLILFIPMVIVLCQLNLRFSRVPLAPGDSFILKAKLMQPLAFAPESLRLPHGLALTAPPVDIPMLQEVDWRIRANEKGVFSPALLIGGRLFTKRVVVSSDLVALHATRERTSVLNWFINPGEKPLPAAGPLRAIDVSYLPRAIRVGPFAVDWLVVFFVAALLSALVVKVLMRVEL
jgi:hypothetical protein